MPDSFARKQERNKKEKADLDKRRGERKTTIKQRREEWRQKAEGYQKNQTETLQSLIKERRVARSSGSFYVPAEAKVAFVIRLKG